MPVRGGDILQGALGGATLGSTVPGIGTLGGAGIGAGLGLLGGLFGSGPQPGEQDLNRLRAFADQMGNFQGMGPAAQAGYSDFRGDQRGYIDQLKALSEGRGPSLASQMLAQNVNHATENQYAQAAGARGNASLANRQALNNAAMMQGQAAEQAANARVQEQLGALQQLGLGIYGARGQDESLGMFNTGQTNDMTRANGALQQQQNALRLQALQGAMGGGMQQGMWGAQQPSWGDYLMAFGGGMGQLRGFGQQGAPGGGSNPQSLWQEELRRRAMGGGGIGGGPGPLG